MSQSPLDCTKINVNSLNASHIWQLNPLLVRAPLLALSCYTLRNCPLQQRAPLYQDGTDRDGQP